MQAPITHEELAVHLLMSRMTDQQAHEASSSAQEASHPQHLCSVPKVEEVRPQNKVLEERALLPHRQASERLKHEIR